VKVKIAPSILAADQADLKNEVARVEEAGADMIHVRRFRRHFAPISAWADHGEIVAACD